MNARGRARAKRPTKPIVRSPEPTLALMVASLALDRLEASRIGLANEKRAAERNGLEGEPVVAYLAALVEQIAAEEHRAELRVCRALRATPYADFQRRTVGLGEKQFGRFLAAIGGEPYWHTRDERPRLVSELWSYCGVGDAARQRRTRGQRLNWNPEARKRLWCIADSCMKQRNSPYRAVYDARRERDSAAVHDHPCAQCGGGGHRSAETQNSGVAAPAGSPLRDGHKHARALRAVMKAVLVDLWEEGRRLHAAVRGEFDPQLANDLACGLLLPPGPKSYVGELGVELAYEVPGGRAA